MLLFIDESWQENGKTTSAALGAVAIPEARYNTFCTKLFALKKRHLGATELTDKPLKASKALSRSAFSSKAKGDPTPGLDLVDAVLKLAARQQATYFARWTTDERWINLRSEESTDLSFPYKMLLNDFHFFLKTADEGKGLLMFDQRNYKADLAAACAIQNYIARANPCRSDHLIVTPHFTQSGSSPGIQLADLVAYLGAQQANPEPRPELAPYWERVKQRSTRLQGGRASVCVLRPGQRGQRKRNRRKPEPPKRRKVRRTDPSK